MKNKEVLNWISVSIRGKKHHLVVLTVIQVLLGLLSVLIAFLLKFLTHGLEIGDRAYFLNSAYITIGAVVAILGLSTAYRLLYEHAYVDIENALKQNLFSGLLESPYELVKGQHKEDWIHRISEDTRIVSSNILSILPSLGRMGVQLIGAFAFIIYISPLFGLILLPISLFLLLLTYVLRKRLKKYHNDVLEKEGHYKVFLSESLEGLAIIHSFVKEDVIANLGSQKLGEYKKARIRKNNFSSICSIGFLLLYYGSYLFGILFCGLLILDGKMQLDSLVSIIALLTQIQSPISNITSILPRFYALLASAERLIEPGKKEKVKAWAKEKIDSNYEALKSINIKDLCFCYEEGKRVLTDLNLTINKGDHIALIGHSGIGKTTLFKLLLALYEPESGFIELVTSEGIRNLNKEDRNLLGYVPQDSLILKGSIKDNVTFFSSQADEKKLEKAYECSCSSEFIRALPSKDSFELTERGSGLSAGQLQRLSLARAYYADKPILLLDEATSALDASTSKQVLANLFSQKEKTILLITHQEEGLPEGVKKIKIGD